MSFLRSFFLISLNNDRRALLQTNYFQVKKLFRKAFFSSEPPSRGSPSKLSLPGIKSIIAIASGKGGVGKSTTSVNLAIALSTIGSDTYGTGGINVGLLDADVYGPSIPMLMNLHGKPKVSEEKMLIPLENYGIKCMSMGFMIADDSPMIWRGPMVMSALEQMLRQTAWGNIDILVIDLPPGTGDAQLSISQRVPVNGAIIVCTPQDLALLDAVRGTNMFRTVNIPIFGIIENMSYFVCPKCSSVHHIFGHGGAKETAAKKGIPFLGEIPLDPLVRELSDLGKPIVVSEPKSSQANIYRSIAKLIHEKLREEKPKGPSIVLE